MDDDRADTYLKATHLKETLTTSTSRPEILPIALLTRSDSLIDLIELLFDDPLEIPWFVTHIAFLP